MTDTPCRTGAADQPRRDGTGRSRVVNTSPCPCGISVDGPAGLGPGPLLEQQELAAGVVAAGAAQVDHDLQREHEVAVQVTVQRVPVVLPVPQQDRR